jgi:hypothetical protein
VSRRERRTAGRPRRGPEARAPTITPRGAEFPLDGGPQQPVTTAESITMTQEQRKTLIDRYAAGPDEVSRALAGFPAGGLTAHPIAGKWSAAEIVHHLADSEMTAALRLRRLVAEDHPVIHGYDQEQFAVRMRYNDRDIAPSLALFRATREGSVPLLRAMRDGDWERHGWHTESGLYTSERWLEIYAAHAHDHAAQIRRLREALAV